MQNILNIIRKRYKKQHFYSKIAKKYNFKKEFISIQSLLKPALNDIENGDYEIFNTIEELFEHWENL